MKHKVANRSSVLLACSGGLIIFLAACGEQGAGNSATTTPDSTLIDNCGITELISYGPSAESFDSAESSFTELSEEAAVALGEAPTPDPSADSGVSVQQGSDSTDSVADPTDPIQPSETGMAAALESLADSGVEGKRNEYQATDEDGIVVAQAQMTTLNDGSVRLASISYIPEGVETCDAPKPD